MRGNMKVWVIDGGKLYLREECENLVVTQAKTQLANLVREADGSFPIRVFALGSNNTATAGGQTKLFAEQTRKLIPPAGIDTPQQGNYLAGDDIIIRQVFGPGLSFTLREAALFADIAELPNPTVAPILTSQPTGGTLADGTYTVGYVWLNATGRSLLSPTAQVVISGGVSSGSIDATIPPFPQEAAQVWFYGSVSGGLLANQRVHTQSVTYTIVEAFDGIAPPVSNNTALPGVADSGTMINRVVLSDLAIISSTTFVLESTLTLS